MRPVYVGNIARMVFGLKSTVCLVYFAYVGYVLFFGKVPYVRYVLDMLCAKCVMEKDRTFGICWTYCSYGVCFKRTVRPVYFGYGGCVLCFKILKSTVCLVYFGYVVCGKLVCYEKVLYFWYMLEMLEMLFVWSLCLKVPYIRYFNLTRFIFPITWHTYSYHQCVSSLARRRTYVCKYFDYAYVGVRKDIGKDWNNHFIAFTPFLCGLTLELSHHLPSICALVLSFSKAWTT